jgi:hypothetical protein
MPHLAVRIEYQQDIDETSTYSDESARYGINCADWMAIGIAALAPLLPESITTVALLSDASNSSTR